MFLVVMGLAFALVGAGVDIGVALGAVPSVLLLMGSIFLVVGLVITAVGVFMVRGARAKAALLATGLAGTGRIVSVRQTSVMVNNQPLIAIGLQVEVPGRVAYPVELKEIIPFIRLPQIQPGGTLAVKVDPQRPERVAIDWGASSTVAPAGYPGLAPVGQVAQFAGYPGVVPQPVPGGPAAPGTPGGPEVPTIPEYAASLPVEQLREQVRSIGAPGRAVVDAVNQIGPQGDKIAFQLGMWVQLDSGPSYRLDNAPVQVEVRYAALVRPGVAVPLRIAQVRPGVTMTVLEWEKLVD
jgi:hypothetical protein